jgi:hypothetical protein
MFFSLYVKKITFYKNQNLITSLMILFELIFIQTIEPFFALVAGGRIFFRSE